MLAPTRRETMRFLYHRTEWGQEYQFEPYIINTPQNMKDCKAYCNQNPLISVKLILGPNIFDEMLELTEQDESFPNQIKAITFQASDEEKRSTKFNGTHLYKYTALKKLDLSGATGVTFENLRKCIVANSGLIYLGLRGFKYNSMKNFMELLKVIPENLLMLAVPNWELQSGNKKPWSSIKTNVLKKVCHIDFTGTGVASEFVRALISNSDNLRRIYGISEEHILTNNITTDLRDNILKKIDPPAGDNTTPLEFDQNPDNRDTFLGPNITLFEQLSEIYGITL